MNIMTRPMDDLNLSTLINSYLAGNELASEKIYQASYTMLYNTAIKFLQNVELAKDVIQNTYIKIFANLSRFKYVNDASTFSWMKRICFNECVTRMRQNKKWFNSNKRPFEKKVSNSHELYSNDIKILIQKLPKQQRLAFDLYAVQGYSHVEIAEHLGIAASHSRSLVCRARKFLSSCYKTEFNLATD